MSGDRRRLLILIGITALAAIVVLRVAWAVPLRNDELFSFPLSVKDWRGVEQEMAPWVFESLETDFAFLREYKSPRFPCPVNLAVVWYDDRNMGFHRPESCLGGVGNTVKSRSVVTVPLSPPCKAVRLTTDHNGSAHVVFYLYAVGDTNAVGALEIRLALLLRRLQAKRGAAALVRVMAPVVTDELSTEAALVQFLQDIMPLVPEYTHPDRVGLAAPRP